MNKICQPLLKATPSLTKAAQVPPTYCRMTHLSIGCVCASPEVHSRRFKMGFLLKEGQQMQRENKPERLIKAAPSLNKSAQIPTKSHTCHSSWLISNKSSKPSSCSGPTKWSVYIHINCTVWGSMSESPCLRHSLPLNVHSHPEKVCFYSEMRSWLQVRRFHPSKSCRIEILLQAGKPTVEGS